MATNSTTVTKSVGSGAKVELLASNGGRREWLIANRSTVAIRIFLNSQAVETLRFADNVLCETNAQQNFNGRIEGQMVSGGAVDIEVTEVL